MIGSKDCVHIVHIVVPFNFGWREEIAVDILCVAKFSHSGCEHAEKVD